MALKFNRLVRPDLAHSRERSVADRYVQAKDDTDTMVFMSHKTGDQQAVEEAEYIAQTHRVKVYMAEWDDFVDSDSAQLPDYIMDAIRRCGGFLISVIAEIAASMWIGYEIGGAHAMRKSRSKIMYHPVGRLPSVIDALEWLRSRPVLDDWIRANVLRYRVR